MGNGCFVNIKFFMYDFELEYYLDFLFTRREEQPDVWTLGIYIAITTS